MIGDRLEFPILFRARDLARMGGWRIVPKNLVAIKRTLLMFILNSLRAYDEPSVVA
jgi:hypothetical protein